MDEGREEGEEAEGARRKIGENWEGGKRGKFCVYKVRAAPRREEEDKGEKGGSPCPPPHQGYNVLIFESF